MIEGNGQGNSRQGWQFDSELTNRRANSQGSDSAGSDNQAWERIDAVCDRFEARWLDGDEPQIESFLPADRNPERELTFRELLKLDLDYRWRCDVPRLSAADYAAKFPEYREIIEEEIDRVFAALSDGGNVLMPLDRYPFSEKFGWVADRFGVSWQLNLS